MMVTQAETVIMFAMMSLASIMHPAAYVMEEYVSIQDWLSNATALDIHMGSCVLIVSLHIV